MKWPELISNGCYVARPLWLSYIPNSVMPETAKTTWCVLANRLKRNGEGREYVFPSYDSICLDTGFTRGRVNADLDRLVELGLAVRKKEGRTNHYVMKAPPALKGAEQDIHEQMQNDWADKRSHDYKAVEQRIRQAVSEWRNDLIATGGIDIETLGKRGFLAATSSDFGTDSTSSDMRTNTSSEIGTMTSSEVRTLTTPGDHSTKDSILRTGALPGPGNAVATLIGEADQDTDPVGYSGCVDEPLPGIATDSGEACGTTTPDNDGSTEDRGEAGPVQIVVAVSTGSVKHPKKAPAGPASKSPKGSGLSNEEMTSVCSSLDAMTDYLLFGRASIGQSSEANKALEPTGTNWRQFCKIDPTTGKLTDPQVEQWKHNTFMGYYWFKVSTYRAENNLDLTLPQFNRLAGDIRNLMRTMSKQQLFKYINTVTKYFRLILWMMPGAAQMTMLDEGSLSNPKVKAIAINIQNATKEQLHLAIDAMFAGQTFFQFTTPARPKKHSYA